MLKFRFLFIALALCLLLPSCATVEDLPPDMVITPPDTEASLPDAESDVPQGDYREIVYCEGIGDSRRASLWNDIVFTSKAEMINLKTGEVSSVCSDPLCTHEQENCAKIIIRSADSILVSSDSVQGDPVLYIKRSNLAGVVDNQTAIFKHKVLRYHFYTGELTVLADDLPGGWGGFGMDPMTDTLFFSQSLVDDDGENEYFFYIMDGKTGKTDILSTHDMPLSAEYMIGNTVYCYVYTTDEYVCIDLSQKELTVQPTEQRGEYGDYRYYEENVTQERVYVPEDFLPLCEEHGEKTYQEYTKFDLYRVDLRREDATPELIAEDVLRYQRKGNYVYYYEFAPCYLLTFYGGMIDTQAGYKSPRAYMLDDPNVCEGIGLINEFTEYHVPIHVLDATTLEEVAVIESEQYWISELHVMGNGAFVVWEDRDIPKRYANLSGMYYQTTYGYLYFNKPKVSYEDTVILEENLYGGYKW